MYKSNQFQSIKIWQCFLFLSETESFIVAVQKHPPHTRTPHAHGCRAHIFDKDVSRAHPSTQLCRLCLQASELIRDDGPGLSATNICPDARR